MKNRKWFHKILQSGTVVYDYFPSSWKSFLERRMQTMYRGHMTLSEQKIQILARQHVISQITILLFGFVLLIILGSGIGIYHYSHDEDILKLTRNEYGKGDKSVVLSVSEGEKTEEFELKIAEQTASEKEIAALFDSYFKALEEEIKGKNPSLQKVSSNLKLPATLDGYPFHAEYDIQDVNYIGYDGALGKEAKELEEGKLQTAITVRASYTTASQEKTFQITIVPHKTEKMTRISNLKKSLQKKEQSLRKEKEFALPSVIDGIQISKSAQGNSEWNIILLAGLLIGGILTKRYYQVKSRAEKAKESCIEDFPLVVHLLSLYMGAGLSFAGALQRICTEYSKGMLTTEGKKRYVFEQMQVARQQIQMGVSQKKACEQWGQRMNMEMYRKLSMILIQCLSKGNREVREYMEQMEEEAFRNQIDRIRKRGEEASSKMLLPMVLLMAAVMIMVMFPAIMQFSNY